MKIFIHVVIARSVTIDAKIKRTVFLNLCFLSISQTFENFIQRIFTYIFNKRLIEERGIHRIIDASQKKKKKSSLITC